MAGSDNIVRYTFVGGYVRRVRAAKDDSFEAEDAYCGGSGVIPGSEILIKKSDPRCKGTGFVVLPGKREQYKRCGLCEGTGRDPNNVLVAVRCKNCDGTSLVKIR